MTETSLDAAHQHVREGLEQIACQTNLIVKLEANGDKRRLSEARRVLAAMLMTQCVLEADLIRLEGDGPPTSVPYQRERASETKEPPEGGLQKEGARFGSGAPKLVQPGFESRAY